MDIVPGKSGKRGGRQAGKTSIRPTLRIQVQFSSIPAGGHRRVFTRIVHHVRSTRPCRRGMFSRIETSLLVYLCPGRWVSVVVGRLETPTKNKPTNKHTNDAFRSCLILVGQPDRETAFHSFLSALCTSDLFATDGYFIQRLHGHVFSPWAVCAVVFTRGHANVPAARWSYWVRSS